MQQLEPAAYARPDGDQGHRINRWIGGAGMGVVVMMAALIQSDDLLAAMTFGAYFTIGSAYLPQKSMENRRN